MRQNPIADAIFTVPTDGPKNDFTLKMTTTESSSADPLAKRVFRLPSAAICNSAGKRQWLRFILIAESYNFELTKKQFMKEI